LNVAVAAKRGSETASNQAALNRVRNCMRVV
jgi:hypothetical protein